MMHLGIGSKHCTYDAVHVHMGVHVHHHLMKPCNSCLLTHMSLAMVDCSFAEEAGQEGICFGAIGLVTVVKTL